jgi:vacuolar-type H+-ATPase subunit I/STV1
MHPHFIRGNIDGLYQITLSERSSASSQMIENNPTLQPNADFTPINDPPHQSTNYEDEEELTSLIWRSNAHADDNTVIPEFTTEEQRIQYNRERSREHARKTRIRKKEYVERLKISFDELRRERDTLLSERTSASSQMIENNPTLQPNADFTPINDPPHQSTNYEDEEELTSWIWRSNAHMTGHGA